MTKARLRERPQLGRLRRVRRRLQEATGLAALRTAGARQCSIVPLDDAVVGVAEAADGWRLLAWAPSADALPPGLAGAPDLQGDGILLVAPADAGNSCVLRSLVPWLRPRSLGTTTSFGVGDRVGFAGPGQIRAFQAHPGVAPTLAQQSARELGRTGRTFLEVVDAATWAALACGWRYGYGADGDHLMEMDHLDAALAAGASRIAADPKALVPPLPADASADAIAGAFARVPWTTLEDDAAAFATRYFESLDIGGRLLPLPRDGLVSAAARFGPAVAHVVAMYRHMLAAAPERELEFEVAVDEVEYPTTLVDHVYIATELRRLGVRWQSFAPRFTGQFEKGIDYRGDLKTFAADVADHAALARVFGPYKLSVHSGSDKFSIYDDIVRATGRLVHLKTSGTSYLEGLRVLARVEPELMRAVWRVALEAYSSVRASYRVSAGVAGMPSPERLTPDELAQLLDTPDAREILHVTFGVVLGPQGHGTPPTRLATEVRGALWAHRDEYWDDVARHIGRHLVPFASSMSVPLPTTIADAVR